MFDEDGARFSPQATRNKSCCCVQGCRSKASKDLTVRFHGFPKPGVDFVNITDKFGAQVKIDRRDAWEQRLMMERKITENSRICSLHFRRSDYILPDAPTQKRYLKKDAVPSCNLPKAEGVVLPRRTARNKISQRKDLVERPADQEPYHFVEVKSEVLEPEIKLETLDLEAIVNQDHCYTLSSFNAEERGRNDGYAIKEEEEEETEIKLEPLDMETDESDCPGAIDLDSSAIKEQSAVSEIKFEAVDLPDIDLNDHFQQVWEPSPTSNRERVSHQRARFHRDKSSQTDDQLNGTKFIDILKTDRALSIMTGVPNYRIFNKIIDIFKLSSPRFNKAAGLRLTIADRIIMTLMKLKQGLSYGVLAIFFRCSSKAICKRIVLGTLDILSKCLKFAIRWPRRGQDSPDIPDDFNEFSNVRCVISRSEIAVRRTKNLTRRIATRSFTRRYHSVKFVTAVSPDGSVCFVSEPYGGQSSHKALFEQSGVIKLLRKNDAVMILKDFPIDDICRENDVLLVRSLFSQNRENSSNLTGYRVRLNVNRRIRRFRIFRRKLTTSLALRAGKILTVICAIENLHRSTLNKTKTS